MSKTVDTPALLFKWKDKNDNFHFVDAMETRHLFYTLRMIWNHSMPEEARSPGYHRYRFGNFYTPEYMKEAIRAICLELSQRTDMLPSWSCELKKFMDHLISKKTLLEAA